MKTKVKTVDRIEQFIKEQNKKGYLLNNLFQLQDGRWRANFRYTGPYTGCAFGDGPTLIKALQNAVVDLQKIPRSEKTHDEITKEKFSKTVKKKRVRL